MILSRAQEERDCNTRKLEETCKALIDHLRRTTPARPQSGDGEKSALAGLRATAHSIVHIVYKALRLLGTGRLICSYSRAPWSYHNSHDAGCLREAGILLSTHQGCLPKYLCSRL